MKAYTAALPNKLCQRAIFELWPDMRYMLSPMCMKSFGRNRHHIVKENGYAIDNGAYGYYTRGESFNGGAFLSLCDEWYHAADWIVVPDKVGDWEETIAMSMRWTNILTSYNRPLLIVAQDGCEVDDYHTIKSILRSRIYGGLFIGGTTDWKLKHLPMLASLCKEAGKICHVGRVNSGKRVKYCYDSGASSIDGSGMSRFLATTLVVCKTLRDLERQNTLF